MRILPSAFLCLLVALASCRTNVHSSLPTTPDDLPSTLFVIDPSRDTTLTTPGGAILKIPKGALDAGAGTPVQLEVKEAYSLEDMLRGGLETRSKGSLLASGGMIYLNVAGGTNATLRKPISVQVPTRNWQPDMQLYKGESNDDGIDWVDPSQLEKDTSENDKDVAAGRALFQANCAACHALSATITGPPLAYITERRDPKWLHDFTRNNRRMLDADAYSCWLFNRYNKTPMNTFPVLSGVGMDRLYKYIAVASRKYNRNAIVDEKVTYDSCLSYLRQLYWLELRSEQLTSSNSRIAAMNIDSLADVYVARAVNYLRDHPGRSSSDRARVDTTLVDTSFIGSPTIIQPPISYYGFSIGQLGWYNVDRLLKGLPGVIESELRVQLTGQYKQPATVYLVIPSMNVAATGYPVDGKNDEYTFLASDGKVPLPQGATGYILTLGKFKDQVTLGKFRWTIRQSQQLSVQPGVTTKTTFDKAIAEMHLGAMQFDDQLPLAGSINARNTTEIHQLDSAMRKLQTQRPTTCDCKCIAVGEAAAGACNPK